MYQIDLNMKFKSCFNETTFKCHTQIIEKNHIILYEELRATGKVEDGNIIPVIIVFISCKTNGVTLFKTVVRLPSSL